MNDDNEDGDGEGDTDYVQGDRGGGERGGQHRPLGEGPAPHLQHPPAQPLPGH